MRKILLPALFSILFFSCDKGLEPEEKPNWDPTTPVSTGELVQHTYYKLAYSEEHEQALWVFYKLYPDLVNGETERTDDFREDPLVSTGSATLADYVGSGYDRGHLCPAGSMDLNETAMSESFFMSNMSPQHPSCNRGKWKSLETLVRTWTNTEDTLYVVSGPIFKDNIEVIGESNVTVPGYYYKAIYDPTGTTKMIGFIMPNAKMENDVSFYAVTIDQIETETGINFFQGVEFESQLESQSNFEDWE